jgi:hypothetical protein
MNIELLGWMNQGMHWSRPKWTNDRLRISGSEPSDFINEVSYLKLFAYQISPSKIF